VRLDPSLFECPKNQACSNVILINFQEKKMNKNFKFLTAVLAFMFCLTVATFGQRTSGNIEGTVTDPNGAAVPQATVTATSTGSTTGFNQTTTTDSNGRFHFSQIPVGTYSLSASGSGFKTQRQDVTVTLDNTTFVNPTLDVGVETEVVEVVADSNLTIDPTGTKVNHTIDQRIIENLPPGATFAGLLTTAPNVRSELGGFQIDGASGSENVFIVDGQEVTNFRTGSLDSNFNIPFESIQEVQIKSTGYEAEYGGATGGIVNVVTAGGNDRWRGSFGSTFRPSKLQGRPNNVLLSFNEGILVDGDVVSQGNLPGNTAYFRPNKDGGTDWFPVARVSGPIVKQHLWFAAVYAPQIFETTRTVDYFSNSIAGNNPQNPDGRFINQSINYQGKVRQEHAFFRLDAAPTERLRVYGTFLWNPRIQEGVLASTTEGFGGEPQSVDFGGSTGVLTGAELLRQQGGRQNANAYNFQATWNPNNWLILNGRVGRSFLNEKLNSYGLPQVTRVLCSQVSGFLTPAETGCDQGFQNVANNRQIIFDVSTRQTFDLDAGFVGVDGLGRHNFKVGYQSNRLFNTVELGYRHLGLIQLFYGRAINALAPVTPTAPLCTAANFPNCVYGSGLMTRFGTIGEASSKNQALFAQDSWQIGRRLTLNLGLRIENENVPNFGDDQNSTAIKFGWGDKISPRLGVAYDPTGDGKTKIFANYGWFYDRFKYELPRGSFGGDFFRRDFFEITPARGELYTDYTHANILGGAPDPIGGTCPIVGGPGYSVCQFDFRIATNLVGADIFETGGVDPNIKSARQSEYTIGAEHELGSNFVVTGRYTHKQVDRAIEDVGVFNDQGSEAYIIGNPGIGLTCEISTLGGYPCTKAERKYDAVEVSLNKRATSYYFNASYTWSRLFGNYSGLASTDEDGRNSPNVNRYFDLPPLGYTADGEPDNGLLATDRTHSFKAYGGYTFDWKGNNVNTTSLNAFTTIQSGTPLTTYYNLYSLGTTILNERGDLGRTDTVFQTDFSVNHRYRFGRDNRYSLEGFLDINNLFDRRGVTNVANDLSSTNFNATNLTNLGQCTTCQGELETFQTIFNGGGIRQFVLNVLSNPDTPIVSRISNAFGQPTAFQAPREVRFGFRFSF
jgi:hypothetical protein